MKTEIISFYCDIGDDTYYSDNARRLRINCNENNIPHDIRELPSKGEYRLNCLAKPKFILSLLEEKKKPLIWMDVDSIIHAELSVYDEFESKCDLGLVYWSTINYLYPRSTVMYFNYTEPSIEFLKYWILCCENNEKATTGKVFDHEILMYQVMPEFVSKIRLAALPANYSLWPGTTVPDGILPMVTIGISTSESKENGLREMGLDDNQINFNMMRT
jgi:hypothetical protein